MIRWTTKNKKRWGFLAILLFLSVSALFLFFTREQQGSESELVFQANVNEESPSAAFQLQTSKIKDSGQTEQQDGQEQKSDRSSSTSSDQNLTDDSENDKTEEVIMVDIKGAVHSPGVYRMEEGDRIQDVIRQAGNITDEGSTDSINLAQRVFDGMVVYVPTQEDIEEEPGTSVFQRMTNTSSAPNSSALEQRNPSSTKINLNSATADELETLTGIGPSKAEAIIEYREAYGPFQTVEDLMNISGIGPKTLERIKDDLE